jgi:arginyl-tRNA---protein transferase
MVGIDGHRTPDDQGIYPGLGGCHMYHRLDGKLIAVGVLDICTTTINSAYFLYDPDYRFLNIGIVGALVEMEYLRLIRQQYNPKLAYYHLGELNITCPKVNYKVNFQPGGLVLCPTTKQWLPYA